ncbi:MAG: CPBP family intramembrane glutamic endopeptidase [Planctomycetota bacterium]
MGQEDTLKDHGRVQAPLDPPWGILDGGFVVVALLALQTALMLPAALILRHAVAPMAAAVSGQLLVLGLAVTVVRLRSGRDQSVARLLGLRRPRDDWMGPAARVVFAGVAGFVGARMAMTAALDFVGLDWRQLPGQEISEMVRRMDGFGALALAALLAVVVAPVAEEVIFRSVLYLPLRRRLGAVSAALIVAVVFSAGHAYLLGAAQLFVLSVVFSALFETTGSLWAPVVAHAVFNAVNISVLRLLPFA